MKALYLVILILSSNFIFSQSYNDTTIIFCDSTIFNNNVYYDSDVLFENQLGQVIDEGMNEMSTPKMSFSYDGNTVSIASANHVRIFNYNGNSWQQLGQDIDAELPNDYSGRSVSLTPDGSTVAIGSPSNSLVRIYNFNGDYWQQLGQDITGAENPFWLNYTFGESVSISADGNKVAIGAPEASDGRVYLYYYNVNSEWQQITSIAPNNEYEYSNSKFGKSVSISGDGNIVVIGAPYWSLNVGKMHIYDLSEDFPFEILSRVCPGWQSGRFGYSTSISSDGNTVAVGAPYIDSGNQNDNIGCVYLYSIIGNSWQQLGQSIYGEYANDGIGRSLSLSADGNKVAIGSSSNDGNGNNSGHVRIFNLNGNNWQQLGQDIDGEVGTGSGSSVSLSPNGNMVAISSTYSCIDGFCNKNVRIFNISNYVSLINDCESECAGAFGSSAYVDNCGICVGGNTGNLPCTQDCTGEWGGSAWEDACGVCVGGSTGLIDCMDGITDDCNGEFGGWAYIDNCGICVGGSTGITSECTQDCIGDWGGSAYIDNCGECVGGSTGLSACTQDCIGDWGGSAYIDNCGECVGGSTGFPACTQDCMGNWGGWAYIDSCGICVGGSTGLPACTQDCSGIWGGSAQTITSIYEEFSCDDGYEWLIDGIAIDYYSSSGIYTYINGCNEYILELTINSSTSNTTEVTACDNYTWINGVNYTESGTYIYESTNNAGCTHIDILNLNINYSPNTSDILGVTNVNYLQTETYSVSQSLNSTYAWNLNNGGIILNGINTNSALVQWGNNSGIYELYLVETNEFLCSDTVFIGINLQTNNEDISACTTSITQSGDILTAITEPIDLANSAYWYNIQTINDTTRYWLMAENTSSFTPTFDCSYFIIASNENCSDTSSVYYYAEEARNIGQLSTSPNPTSGNVKVNFDNNNNQFVRLYLISNSGYILDEFLTKNNELEIDLSSYPSGTYHISFNSPKSKGCLNEDTFQKVSNTIILNK